MKLKKPAEFRDIVETIFFNEFLEDDFFNDIVGFCIDNKGRVRKNLGMISMSGEDDENVEYVPRDRYEISGSPWNSHQHYVEINLPNPATQPKKYSIIRNAFISELEKRGVSF